MSVISTYASCPNVQAHLKEAFVKKNPAHIVETQRFTEFLVSDMNRDMFIQETTSTGNAKKRTVEVVYNPRILEADINTSQTRVCESSVKLGDQTETYSIDDTGSEFNFYFDPKDVATRCQRNPLYLAEKILDVMHGLMRKVETLNVQQALTKIGSYASSELDQDGTAIVGNVKEIQTRYSDGKINPDFLVELQEAAENMGYPTPPVLLGFGEISKTMTKYDSGCCADSGLNLESLLQKHGIALIKSIKVPQEMDTDHFLMFSAGALQMIWWNEFDGDNMIDDESYKQGMIMHPILGIPFDYLFNINCGAPHIQLKLAHKLIGMPDDMFFGTDRLHGVTFVNEVGITNP